MTLPAKISAPRFSGTVPRERLFRKLDECLRRPAVWISSPAGSGKTSLITSYLEACKLPCLWYNADSGDGDIATFFYYMGLAVKKAAPRFRKTLPVPTPEYLMGIPVFARRYFEELYRRVLESVKTGTAANRIGPSFVIVLDNYQLVPAESPFHEVINTGLSLIPERINVLIISRDIAPQDYARLFANNAMSRLGWEDIRLTEEEAREIVRAREERTLSDEILTLIHRKTGGWVAGLVLLMESSKSTALDSRLLNGFTPEEIFEYFAAEIFRGADPQEQEFLLATAFLPSMTAQMAEALTGNKGSERLLRRLNERNYFTERHLKEHPVVVYHPLFREFLLAKARDTFAPEKIVELQRKAAELLTNAGQAEDAAELFVKMEDWGGLASLVLSQAPVLISRGRNRTVEEWLSRIPKEMIESTPWLLYWKGICSMSFDPAESRALFVRAHRSFRDKEDDLGALASWVGAADACFYEFDDFKPLDELIDWLDERAHGSRPYPSPEIEAHVAAAMSCALLWRRPAHPEISDWIRKASSLSQNNTNAVIQANVPISAVTYYSWMGKTSETRIVLDRIRRMAESRVTPPLLKITSNFIETHYYMDQGGEYGKSLISASKGLALADETGIHLLDSLFFSQMAFGALIVGNRSLTGEYLKKMESAMGSAGRGMYGLYYTILSLHNLNLGRIPDAVAHAEKAVSLTEEAGIVFPEAMSRVLLAQTSFEAGDHEEAVRQLSVAEAIVSRIGSRYFGYTCTLMKAYFAFELGHESEALAFLRDAWALAKRHGYTYAPYFWRPDIMSRLCMRSLNAGIEVDYARTVIQRLGLLPLAPSVEVENWPWPVKILSLGCFEVLRDGLPLEFPVKAPRRIITLLQVLISCGVNGASERRLADLLWPDADGDAAHRSLTTSIHRLRQLLGNDKAIQYRDGQVKLATGYCHVDAHAFEELLDVAENRPQDTRVQTIEKALNLYKGAFLNESDELWAVSYRERLREKYLKAVRRLGSQYEGAGLFDQAVECYRQGLEIDDLAEEFYYRSMRCYASAGRKAEAVALYNKCRRRLQSALGVDPSPQTEALFRELNRRVRPASSNDPSRDS